MIKGIQAAAIESPKATGRADKSRVAGTSVIALPKEEIAVFEMSDL